MTVINQSQLKSKLAILDSENKVFTLLCRALLNSKLATLNKNQIVIEDSHFDLVTRTWIFLKQVNLYHATNWISFDGLTSFLTRLFSSETKIITPFIIMCPSYHKDGSVGFNNTLGRTSIVALGNFKFLSEQLHVLFPEFTIQPVCYFGDLGIEQYAKASNQFWDGETLKNFTLINSHLANLNFTDCQLVKLSDEDFLNSQIGRAGNINKEISTNYFKEIEAVKIRNRTFYCDNLGWTKEDSDNRTEISATFYSTMGKYFNEKFEVPLFLYTANSYEKAVSYNLTTDKKKQTLDHVSEKN
jgi:hypothetical protein